MGGPIKSKYYTYSSDQNGISGLIRNCFAGIASYFDSRGGFQRIASNYGGGTGFGFTSTQNKVGNEAFGIWRAISSSVIYDVAVACATSDFTRNWISNPVGVGNVGIVVAYHSSSAAWNGTTNNNGTDTFTTPWKSGTVTTLAVNRTGSNPNALLSVLPGNITIGNQFFSSIITGDYDATVFMFFNGRNESVGSTTQYGSVFGKYEPASSSITVPLVQWDLTSLPSDPTAPTIGNLTTATEGGLLVSNSRTRRFGFEYYIGELKKGEGISNYTIVNLNDANLIQEFGANIWSDEVSGSYTDIGKLPLINLVTNYLGGNLRFYRDGSRLVVYSYAGGCISVPWDSTSLNRGVAEIPGW